MTGQQMDTLKQNQVLPQSNLNFDHSLKAYQNQFKWDQNLFLLSHSLNYFWTTNCYMINQSNFDFKSSPHIAIILRYSPVICLIVACTLFGHFLTNWDGDTLRLALAIVFGLKNKRLTYLQVHPHDYQRLDKQEH